jgi:hypothetical protein
MTDVACFCGCLFSFEGGAGACPRCGKVASVTAGPVSGSPGRRQPETPVPVMSRVGQNGETARAYPGRAAAGSPAGIAIATVARRDRTTRKRRTQP